MAGGLITPSWVVGCGKATVMSVQFGAACVYLSSTTNELLLLPQAETEALYKQALGHVFSSAIIDLFDCGLYFSEVIF